MKDIKESTKEIGERFLAEVEVALIKAFRACETAWDIHELYQYILGNKLLPLMRSCKQAVRAEKTEVLQNGKETEEV